MTRWFRFLRIIIVAVTAIGAVAVAAVRVATPTLFQPFPVPPGKQLIDVAFTSSAQTLYITSKAGKDDTILESTRSGGGWSAPRVVPFSGTWRDLEEVITPDGSAMIFASNRPVAMGGRPLDAFYYGRYLPKRGGNLWIVRRSGAGWGTPQRLPDAINANTSTYSPAIAADGTLYFMRASGKKGVFHLFTSRREAGSYRSSAPAPFGDPRYAEFDPTVAPDNSFVIFSSTRPPARKGTADLFISFRRRGTWSPARDMGRTINPAGDAIEPRLSPDAKTLYFTSAADMSHPEATPAPTALGKLWSVDLTPWLTARANNLPLPQ